MIRKPAGRPETGGLVAASRPGSRVLDNGFRHVTVRAADAVPDGLTGDVASLAPWPSPKPPSEERAHAE